MKKTEEILTISGKEFKIILFSKEKVDFAVVPKFGDEEIREMVLDEWEKKINVEDEKIILEQVLKFEVYPYDLGKYTWNYAKIATNELGSDWRLPTIEELNLMYLNKNEVGAFAPVSYWSDGGAVPMIEYAWAQNFSNGHQYSTKKSSSHYVRPVRSITI